jgi:hypothetical protein
MTDMSITTIITNTRAGVDTRLRTLDPSDKEDFSEHQIGKVFDFSERRI